MKKLYDLLIDFFSEWGDPKKPILIRLWLLVMFFAVIGGLCTVVIGTVTVFVELWPYGTLCILAGIAFVVAWFEIGKWAYKVKQRRG